MPSPSSLPWQALADTVLLLHLGVVAFVIGGLVLTLAGRWRGWAWVRRPGFRWAHGAAIGVVVAEAWLGLTCPLTTLESWLRAQAGQLPDGQGFIERWVQAVLYYDLPAWVFTLAYTAFAVLVLLAWWLVPPRRVRPGGADAS